MFTGFASENTPAIQVWDFFQPYTGTARISLTDDCASIQIIRTGGDTTAIQLYLPSAPIEGKQIKIINARYGPSEALVQVRSSDRSSTGTAGILISMGAGQTIDLCYSKSFMSAVSGAAFGSGWVFLNQNPVFSLSTNAICFGASNSASGANSAVIGGASLRANGSSAAVVGGTSNTASGTSSAVVGGSSNTASGQNSIVAGSSGSQSTNSGSAVLGGTNHLSNGSNSSVICGQLGTARLIAANLVLSANIPVADNVGVSQAANLILARETTDATATVLRSNTSAAGTTNQVILPNNSAYYVKGSVIATVTGGGDTKSWDFIATIKRGANAAATSIVGAVTLNVQAADAGAATWIVAITADTTNGGLAVTVTGQAATTIRWVAKLESTEVTY
jgi:hypothetical protein